MINVRNPGFENFKVLLLEKKPETSIVKLMSANTDKLARKWIIKHIVFFLTADIVTIDLNQTKQIHRSIIVIINVCTSRPNMRYRTLYMY